MVIYILKAGFFSVFVRKVLNMGDNERRWEEVN